MPDLPEELDNLTLGAQDIARSSMKLTRKAGTYLFGRLEAHLENGGLADAFDGNGAPTNLPHGLSTFKDVRDVLLRSAMTTINQRATSFINASGSEDNHGDVYNEMFLSLTNNLSEPREEGTFKDLVDVSIRQATDRLRGGGASVFHGQGEGLTEAEISNIPASMLTNPRIQRIAGELGISPAEAAFDQLQLGYQGSPTDKYIPSTYKNSQGETVLAPLPIAGKGPLYTGAPVSILDRFMNGIQTSGSPRPLGLYSMTGRVFDEKGMLSEFSTQPYEGGHQVYVNPEDVTGLQRQLSGVRNDDARTLVNAMRTQWKSENQGPSNLTAETAAENASRSEQEIVYGYHGSERRPGTIDPVSGEVIQGDTGWGGGVTKKTVNGQAVLWENGHAVTQKYGRPLGETDKPSLFPAGQDWGGREIETTMEQVRSGKYKDWVIDPLTQKLIDAGKLQAPNTLKLMDDKQINAFEDQLYGDLEKGGFGQMPRLAYGTEWVGQYPNGKKSLPTIGHNDDEYTVSPIGGKWGDVGYAKPTYAGSGPQGEQMQISSAEQSFAAANQRASAGIADPVANAMGELDKSGFSNRTPSRLDQMKAAVAAKLRAAEQAEQQEQQAAPETPAQAAFAGSGGSVPPTPPAPPVAATPQPGNWSNSWSFSGQSSATSVAQVPAVSDVGNRGPAAQPVAPASGVDADFPVGSNYDQTHPASTPANQSFGTARAPVGNAGRTPADVVRSVGQVSDNATYSDLPNEVMNYQRGYTRGDDNRVNGVQYTGAGGEVTISSAMSSRGLRIAQEGIASALDQGGLENMEAHELPATIMKRVTSFIKDTLDKELNSSDTGVRQNATKIKKLAEGAAKGLVGEGASDLGLNAGSVNDQFNGVSLRSADDIRDAMANDEAFGQRVSGSGLSPEDLAEGPERVFSAGNNIYSTGSGGGGGGGWFGGFSGGRRRGGSSTDIPSPYRTDFGKIIQSTYMAQMAWKDTGGAIMNEARQFGNEQAAMLPMLNYGGGEASGAPTFASQASMARFNVGQVAYNQWGSTITGIEQLSQNQGLVGQGSSLLAGAGAGGILGFGLAQIGATATNLGYAGLGGVASAAALPVGIAAAAAVYGFSQYEGGKAQNVQDALMKDTTEGAFVPFRGRGNSTTTLSQFTPQQLHGMQDAAFLNASASGLAEDRSLNRDQVLADISASAAYTGGNITAATSLVATAQNIGESGSQYGSDINQIAASQGILMGSDAWNKLAGQASSMVNQDPQVYRAWQKDQTQQGSLRNSWASMINSSNWQASAMAAAQGFGPQMNQVQSRAMTTRMSSAVSAGIDTNDAFTASAVADVNQYGIAGSDAISSWQSKGGAYSPETATWASNFAKQEMGLGFSAVDLTSQFGQYKGGAALDLLGKSGGLGQISGLSGSALYGAMDKLGVFSGDKTMQAAYADQGMYGLGVQQRERQFGFQMAGIGIGMAQNAWQREYLWGQDDGGTAQSPTQGSMWGIQNRQIDVQWTGTQAQQKYQVASQSNQYSQWQENKGFQQWNMGFDYQTNLMERGFERQQFQYNRQMTNLNYGWQQQDIDEQIRRSSGYDRALLERQKGRENLSHNLEVGQMDKTQTNQETLWKRQDEAYNKQVQHVNAINTLQDKQFTAERKELERQIKEQAELHKLQLEQIALERENQEKSLDFQKQSLGVQAAAAQAQKDYASNMDTLNKNLATALGNVKEVGNVAPAIQSAMEKILDLKQLKLEMKWSPSGFIIAGNGSTYTGPKR